MNTLKDLLAQQEELTKKIEELRQNERSAALKNAKNLIADFELTAEELFGIKSSTKKVKATAKVEAKYRNPATADTWSGRGIAPKWIKASGKDKSEFLIK